MSTPKKKTNKLNLRNYGRTGGDISKIRKELLEQLGNRIYDIKDWQTFLFKTLEHVRLSKPIHNDEKSIENACAVFRNHFYGHVKPRLKAKKWETTATEFYKTEILGLGELPSYNYSLLRDKVEGDLVKINDLIKLYEMENVIKQYTKKGATPRNHNDGKIFDFYQRCLEERNKILNYYLKGIKERALDKSVYVYPGLGGFVQIGSHFYDYPYTFSHPQNIRYFDYREISLVDHRIEEFSLLVLRDLKPKYNKSKEQFYRSYFKLCSWDEIFKKINFYLNHLPVLKDRSMIFSEIMRLFKGRRWIAFNALALSQIEGLFSEMVNLKSNKGNVKSLPEKVKSIRDDYGMNDDYLDYYQYIIPEIRNKFMHFGKYRDSEYKLRAYDLLIDLRHLLSIFDALDNPYVKIQKIHVRHNPDDFISVKHFSDYFQLINDLHIDQKQKLLREIKKFEEDFIMKETSIEHFIVQLIESLPKLIEDLTVQIEYAIGSSELAFDIRSMRRSLFKKKILEPYFEEIRSTIQYNSDFNDLKKYRIFLDFYEEYLPSLDSDLKNSFKKVQREYLTFLKNIEELKRKSDESTDEEE